MKRNKLIEGQISWPSVQCYLKVQNLTRLLIGLLYTKKRRSEKINYKIDFY